MSPIALMVPALLAASPAAAATTTLRGGGVALSLDLEGFRKDLDAGPLRGTYWRLGQFSLEPGERSGGLPLVVSVLVDEVPEGVGLAELREHVLASDRKRTGGAEVAARQGGFTVSFLEEHAPGLAQWHLHYHALHGRKWVELHFSSMTGARKDLSRLRALTSAIVDSVRVASAPAKP